MPLLERHGGRADGGEHGQRLSLLHGRRREQSATIPRLTCGMQFAASAFRGVETSFTSKSLQVVVGIEVTVCRRGGARCRVPRWSSGRLPAVSCRHSNGVLHRTHRRQCPARPDRRCCDATARGDRHAAVIAEAVGRVGQVWSGPAHAARSRWSQSRWRQGSSTRAVSRCSREWSRASRSRSAVLFAEARISQPPTLTGDTARIEQLDELVVGAFGATESVFADHDAGRAARRHLLLHQRHATTTATVAAATNQVRALMTVLANCVGGRQFGM